MKRTTKYLRILYTKVVWILLLINDNAVLTVGYYLFMNQLSLAVLPAPLTPRRKRHTKWIKLPTACYLPTNFQPNRLSRSWNINSVTRLSFIYIDYSEKYHTKLRKLSQSYSSCQGWLTHTSIQDSQLWHLLFESISARFLDFL